MVTLVSSVPSARLVVDIVSLVPTPIYPLEFFVPVNSRFVSLKFVRSLRYEEMILLWVSLLALVQRSSASSSSTGGNSDAEICAAGTYTANCEPCGVNTFASVPYTPVCEGQ